ncbi:hypothetical protein Angca_008243 [Angiostrongylus cantonensis]|nr:hypothetical protein Angca_008243 [Angiostrongylus cantonensis]
MRIWSLALVLIIVTIGDSRLVQNRDFNKARLGKEGYEKIKTIHYNWYLHSIKAIIGQMGKDILGKLDAKNRRQFLRCLNVIVDKKDIVSAARCLVAAKESLHNDDQDSRGRNDKVLPNVLENSAFEMEKSSFLQERHKAVAARKLKLKIKNLEKAAALKKRLSYLSNDSRSETEEPPFVQKLHYVVKARKLKLNMKKKKVAIYNKKQIERRFHFKRNSLNLKGYRSRRMKRSVYRLVLNGVSDKRRADRLQVLSILFIELWKVFYIQFFKLFKVVNMKNAPSLLPHGNKSVVKRVTQLVKTFLGRRNDSTMSNGESKWMDSYTHLLQIKKVLDEQAKKPGARPLMPPLVKEAYNMMRMLEGKSKGTSDSSNMKFLSPRIGAIMPDKNEVKGSLSPSLLPFYKDDSEEQLLPIPKLLDAAGMTEKDRNDILETVMEIAGARQVIDDAMKMLSNTELLGMQGELKDVTEKMMRMFTKMERTFTIKQKADMKRRGYTFLEKHQLRSLHNQNELAKHRSELDFDIDEYGKQSHSEREEALWLRLAEIAANGTKSRTKRQITLLTVLKPTVLHPYMFSPIFGATILGPVVLSPSLFSPLILNPAALSPYVLSPAIAMPFILSPYVLSPYVLSPLVMAPFILSPYVLSPNVINPYVLSPLVLSPYVLCPDLLSPMVLGGPVLSPAVLSPSVLSKSFLMASVLSPTVLS